MIKVKMMFRSIDENTLMTRSNLKSLLVDKAAECTKDVQFLSCHKINQRLLPKNFNVRLPIFCKRLKARRKQDIEKS